MFPVYKVIDFTSNRYLLSRALMKRARQINFVGDDDLVNFEGKIVSLALKQILNDEIKYTLTKEVKKES